MAVHFSNHAGFPSFAGTRMTGDQLLELLDGLERNGLLAGYTHLLTGACPLRAQSIRVSGLRPLGFQGFGAARRLAAA